MGTGARHGLASVSREGSKRNAPLRLVAEFQAEIDALSPEVRTSKEDCWTCGARAGIEPGVGRELRAAHTLIHLISRTGDRAPVQERVPDRGPQVCVDLATDVDPDFGDHRKYITGKLAAVARRGQEPHR